MRIWPSPRRQQNLAVFPHTNSLVNQRVLPSPRSALASANLNEPETFVFHSRVGLIDKEEPERHARCETSQVGLDASVKLTSVVVG